MTDLFVYGTLMSGHAKAPLLGARPRHDARVEGTLYDLPAGYPALVLGGTEWVHGEVVQEVDDALLRLLDHYEGVDEGLYRRVQVSLRWGLRARLVWTYVMDHPERRGGKLIASGRWRATRRRGR